MIDKPHKKLDVWRKSIDLVQIIYDLTRSFPKNEAYGLAKQMRRAAISIPSNIGEGAARQTKREFVQFLHMAQGSLSELDTHLEISKRLNYLKEDNLQALSSLMNEIDKMITGLIKSLKK
ncbi:four helix bundle protein [Candidatus Aminicenantes bacterium AC-708-M15]|jgi:four helix bundle protein|nr:four helix bundle protein [Candidatus Aminicenantes bacterium AC-335-L06]MCP2604127.1 four helix bundle protein [Candidatus Aminicenantes bacterium AC-708-M15]